MSGTVAIVGAGPSGFYAADQLLHAGFAVDLLDRLPTPYGLVRAGVAPDNQKMKSVTRVYERTAGNPGFRYFGGVEFDRHVSREGLLEHYHAVVYAVGSSGDRQLGIPGEELRGSHAATEFVAWYNGHPDFADRSFDLDSSCAVIVGNGNVALDVARMLVRSPEELDETDIADHALAALRRSAIREVVVLGRRGPAQAAFTTPELRELGQLSRADVVVDDADINLDPLSAAWLASNEAHPTAKRNVEVLRDYAARRLSGKSHRIVMRFLLSPEEILGDRHGRIRALRVVRNRVRRASDGRLRAEATDQREVIECGLVLRAVGYRGVRLPGVPFDEKRGVIRNDDGRVLAHDGSPLRGEYAVGWIKRGATGVIGTNKKCAAGTVAHIVEDAEAGRLNEPARGGGREAAAAWLRDRAPDHVAWDGWTAIDEHECRAGAQVGRPRVKVVHVDEMCRVAREASLSLKR
jgi:ferredoxin--NADP+ reductase